MDSFNFGNLKAEKANAIMKRQKLQKIANLFRFVEVCVALILISRISFQLPVAVKNSGDYFRDLSVFVVSPRFVFVIGNVIVITLFAQSGQFSAHGYKSKSSESESELYQQLIQNSTKNQKIKEEQNKYPEKQSIRIGDEENQEHPQKQNIRTEDEENHKYPEKQSTRTENTTKNQRLNEENEKYPEKHSRRTEESIKKQRIDGGKIKWLEKQCFKTRDRKRLVYRRCETEKFSEFQSEKPPSVLRRSETEKNISSYPEDDMSNDEFRRTVEAFIARQQRLQREEEYSTL